MGWFENVHGDATKFLRHPIVPEHLGWHGETRVAVGDVDGDGRPEVVITESEIGPTRLAILHGDSPHGPWEPEILVDRDQNLRALHTLQLIDLDGDGELEIFTAEMENGKTDGVTTKPRWWVFDRQGDTWHQHPVLDANLGAHTAIAADYDGDGRIEMVGKIWRANKVNGVAGKNHVDWLRPV
jgi:hypothetical protein